MLVLDNVYASYGSVVALRGISVRVDEGEIVGLIGANGAGKTTTLGAIAGVVEASDGEIHFCGDSLRGQAPEDIVRKGIGLVPEGRRVFPGLTVAENLRLGAAIRSDQVAIQKDVAEMCELFPILGERLHSSASRMSGGEQQQLAIARTLMSHPKLLMLDEPSLGLAPKLVQGMFDLVSELRDMGMTILLVEQNVAKTLKIANRVYVMKTGAILAEGRPDEVKELVDIRSAYLGGESGGRRKAIPL